MKGSNLFLLDVLSAGLCLGPVHGVIRTNTRKQPTDKDEMKNTHPPVACPFTLKHPAILLVLLSELCVDLKMLTL